MKIKVRKADRTDLAAVSALLFENEPVFGSALSDRFDEILSQTGHSVLLCFVDGELCGTLSVSVIDGLSEKFPLSVFSGGKIKKGADREAVSNALISKGEELSRAFGCKKILS
ncbi:MAG: hypothetical protein Q4D20_03670 [Clostridia bacterium]|nr:hypothetical protein [Clostridia bacterium]